LSGRKTSLKNPNHKLRKKSYISNHREDAAAFLESPLGLRSDEVQCKIECIAGIGAGKAAGPRVDPRVFGLGIAVQPICFIIQTPHKSEAIPQNRFECLPGEVLKTT